jgi:hypothetical protein
MLLAVVIYALVATFVESARVLMPWTITATLLGGLVTLALTRLLRPRIGPVRLAVALPATIALTLGFGYLAWAVHPPSPAPPKPKQDIVEFLFTFPEPRVTKEDLFSMLPVHLTISGLLGGMIVSGIVGGSVALGTGKPKATRPDEPFD